jgi:hypothetical protein
MEKGKLAGSFVCTAPERLYKAVKLSLPNSSLEASRGRPQGIKGRVAHGTWYAVGAGTGP